MSSKEALARWQASIGNDAEQPAPSATGPSQAAGNGAPIGLPSGRGVLEWRKKTVLLVDSNLRSRHSRAKMMRTKGVHVDCVGSAEAARVRLSAEKYNLILVDLGSDTEIAESLVREIKGKNSRQLVGFLVGSPLFIVKSLGGAHPCPRPAPAAEVKRAESPSAPPAAPSEVR